VDHGSRARRAALRRDLLAASGLGGRPAPREGCGGPLDLHLALAWTLASSSLRGCRGPALRGPRSRRRVPFPAHLQPGPCRAPERADLLAWPSTWPRRGNRALRWKVSAIDSFANATDGSERRLSIVARHPCRWPGSSGGRSFSATSSTAPWRQPLPARIGRTLARLTCGGPAAPGEAGPGDGPGRRRRRGGSALQQPGWPGWPSRPAST